MCGRPGMPLAEPKPEVALTTSRLFRRTRRHWAAAAVALCVPLTVSVVPSAPPAQAGTATNVLKMWAPKYMERGGTMTRAEAVEEARHFDVIIAKPSEYSRFVADMRAANPRLRLFAYINGTFAKVSEATTYPDAWYVRDTNGEKVRSVLFGQYMMDPNSSGWVQTRISLCRHVIAASGYDGCGLDVLGTTPVTEMTYVTGRPVNSTTGTAWTGQQWLTATTALAASVRSGSGRPIAGNGIGDGPRYFYAGFPSSQLFGGVDVGMAEGFLRSGRADLTAYPTVADWKANVDMLADAGARGKSLVVVTKVWNTGTQSQKDAWHKFALASFLLGSDGRARFSFLYDIALDPGAWHPWWATSLGAPSGPYTRRSDGAYNREFALGRALVNPTGRIVNVPLGAAYTTLDGSRVTALTLAPHSGEVLTR